MLDRFHYSYQINQGGITSGEGLQMLARQPLSLLGCHWAQQHDLLPWLLPGSRCGRNMEVTGCNFIARALLWEGQEYPAATPSALLVPSVSCILTLQQLYRVLSHDPWVCTYHSSSARNVVCLYTTVARSVKLHKKLVRCLQEWSAIPYSSGFRPDTACMVMEVIAVDLTAPNTCRRAWFCTFWTVGSHMFIVGPQVQRGTRRDQAGGRCRGDHFRSRHVLM